MREGVRTNLMTGGEPVANLRSIHERGGDFSVRHVPDILLADASRDNELDGANAILAQRLQRVLERILKAVVKSYDNAAVRWNEPSVCGNLLKRGRSPAGTAKLGQLSREKLLA